MHENTTKLHKKAQAETVSDINLKAKKIAVDLKLENIKEAIPEKEASVSLKDH